jgi:hypothetical protein
MRGEWSGLRESNPSSWLGKPEHYHYAKPADGVILAGFGEFEEVDGFEGWLRRIDERRETFLKPRDHERRTTAQR